MALIEQEAAKAKKVYCEERHEYVVPVAELDRLPTIDAAPVVHSKWKFLNDYESRCSSSGKEIFIDHDDEYRYCPNCGCKMDGGEGHGL